MGRLFDTTQTSDGGRLFGKPSKRDLKTTEGLINVAEQAGLGERARRITEPPERLSVLERLTSGLGAFNPAEAVMTGTER